MPAIKVKATFKATLAAFEKDRPVIASQNCLPVLYDWTTSTTGSSTSHDDDPVCYYY